jgi:hypothetical protein
LVIGTAVRLTTGWARLPRGGNRERAYDERRYQEAAQQPSFLGILEGHAPDRWPTEASASEVTIRLIGEADGGQATGRVQLVAIDSTGNTFMAPEEFKTAFAADLALALGLTTPVFLWPPVDYAARITESGVTG